MRGLVDLPTEGELDPAGGQVIADRAGVRDGAGEAVQLRHHEGVAISADCGKGLV